MEDVTTYLLNLHHKPLCELLIGVLQQYKTEGNNVLAIVEQDDSGKAFTYLVAAPKEGNDWQEDSPICQYGRCVACGSYVISWGKKVVCPSCGHDVYCT